MVVTKSPHRNILLIFPSCLSIITANSREGVKEPNGKITRGSYIKTGRLDCEQGAQQSQFISERQESGWFGFDPKTKQERSLITGVLFLCGGKVRRSFGQQCSTMG
jgi:hypothetical protein